MIFDRDGTLASVAHHKDPSGDIADWGDYNAAVRFDPVVPLVDGIPRGIRPGIFRIMTSGRQDHTAPAMLDWMHKYGLPIDRLWMRRARDTRADSVVKEEIYRVAIEPFYDVALCVDDRPQVVDMWRRVLGEDKVIQVSDPGVRPPILG